MTIRSFVSSCSARAGFLLMAALICGSFARAEEDPSRPSSGARLRFLQQVLREIRLKPTEEDDRRELKFQMKPLLRYNDVPRGIADSTIFRLGTRGRPIALVTAELYGGTGRRFLLNQEFLAIDNPRLHLQRDTFRWQPPKEAGVAFQSIETDQRPADTPRGRLAQFKQLASRFTAREEWNRVEMELRLLPTPIDRYAPSDQPNADGALFAFVEGVNPEAVLLLETDGTRTMYGWARLGAAQVRAQLDGKLIWEVPQGTPGEHPTAGYTFIHRTAFVPVELENDQQAADDDKLENSDEPPRNKKQKP